jgi:hypothetical protein
MGVMRQDSGNFQKLVGLYENPILEYWQDKYTDTIRDSMIKELFDVVQSDNPTEAISEQVGGPEFREWNGEFTYGEVKDGNTKVWTPLVWQAGMAYDRFLLSNAKLIKMRSDHGKFATSAARLRESCAAGIFMNAASSSWVQNGVTLNWTTTADGLPLASHAHTSINYSTVQDNLTHNELNEANLETACQMMFDFKDEDGNDANLQPDTIIVPSALRQTALELIGGEGKYDTADNNPNVYNGNMRVIVWKTYRKLSGVTGHPWVVADSRAMKDSAKWVNRLESGDEYDLISWKSEETQTWKIGSVMWFVAGMYDWRSTVFNIPV